MSNRYPGQADLLNKDWETWAPLLFFGRERQLPGKEDQQIVGEVSLEEALRIGLKFNLLFR